MPEPVLTLCPSSTRAAIGPVKGVLAVCDSPLTVEQVTAAPAFQSWPDTSTLACLSLGDDSERLPPAIRWLVEPPFRRHVVFCRATSLSLGSSVDADALWKQLTETPNVWTGSLAGVSPASRTDWPSLAPRLPGKSWLADAIDSVRGASPRQTTLFKAGLYLVHDYLDESHTQSQSMEGDRDADLWHAIMHRREPDYGNAKYWCRRVGSHPVHDQLAPLAAPILARAGIAGYSSTRWDAFQFVDLCERVERESSPANRAAREVQWLEMMLHLAHCARGR
ncbi:MAG: hypothetical protein U0929_00635 [Planctomycetaceae bacterium]